MKAIHEQTNHPACRCKPQPVFPLCRSGGNIYLHAVAVPALWFASWIGRDVPGYAGHGGLFLVSQNTGLYRSQVRNHLAQSLLRLFSTWVLTGSLLYLLICFVPLFQPHHAFTLNIGLLWLSLACLSSACYRLLYRLVTLCFSTPSHGRRVAIIGVTPTGLAIEKSLWESQTNDIQMLGFFDARSEDRFGYPTRSPVLGEVDKLLALARQGLVDEVYLALPLTARDRINHYLYELSDTTVDTYLVPDFYEYSLTVSQIKRVGDIYTFSVFDSPSREARPCSSGSRIWCWVRSFCCSSPRHGTGGVGGSSLLPGPALFKQDRYGLGGKRIRVWKFRSMRVMENDAVVTQATRGSQSHPFRCLSPSHLTG